MAPVSSVPGEAGNVTLATFNMHMGVDGWGRAFDVIEACRALAADMLVLQESWTPDDGGPSTARRVAEALDYETVAEVTLARGRLFEPLPTATERWGPVVVRKSFRLEEEKWGVLTRSDGRASSTGSWGLALLSRLPTHDRKVISLGKLRRDAAERAVIRCDVPLGEGWLAVHGTHMSHITHGSHAQYRRLARALPRPTTPAVLAGDMNMWGPPVSTYFRYWRRALKARTWPAHRPHSQLDHVLVTPRVEVVDARVGPFAGSDHLPVVVTLSLD
jgi:endonuclease/exonuclease/phosphatase family metal-dependent hydrolase